MMSTCGSHTHYYCPLQRVAYTRLTQEQLVILAACHKLLLALNTAANDLCNYFAMHRCTVKLCTHITHKRARTHTRMHAHTRLQVCTHIYTLGHTDIGTIVHTCAHAHTHTYTHLCMLVRTHAHIHIYARKYAHINTQSLVHTRTHTCSHVCTLAHTYTRAHVHKNSHTCMLSSTLK